MREEGKKENEKQKTYFELTQALLVNVPGLPGILILDPLGEKENTKKKRMIIQMNLII